MNRLSSVSNQSGALQTLLMGVLLGGNSRRIVLLTIRERKRSETHSFSAVVLEETPPAPLTSHLSRAALCAGLGGAPQTFTTGVYSRRKRSVNVDEWSLC